MSKWERVSGQLDNKDLSACDYFVGVFLVFVFLFLLRYKIMAHSVINTPPPRSLAGGVLWRGIGKRLRLRCAEGNKYAIDSYVGEKKFLEKSLHKDNTCVDTLTYAVGY